MVSIAAAAASGFGTGAVLIVAIGAQNLFVLRQGLLCRHVGPVVVLCGLADTGLIAAGVAGAGSLLQMVPDLATVMALGGAAFLGCYGVLALRRATTGASLDAGSQPAMTLGRTLATAAGFTLLNPHVYLDTVVLMGAAGASQPAGLRPIFVAAASAASFGWFATVGFGARILVPLFARPAIWRWLDALVGCTMLILAAVLLGHAWDG
ncbi:LysE family transporter [Lichenihabitans sp. Uapishka_5]|uniref:LysE/ArgO family amino acid transporter n=1 Tax=Lichenihabitans sp. Uapishka_5 TaxID=3037302 RepID=UPI0029E801C3|nr:LysE family transporter [Lichenihabitans sp. Uapishka_5]MDX7953935.1 LysE family transporter [Lichenihabitans sp. Uapishka_5]